MALDLGIFLEGSQSTFKVKVSENDSQAQYLLDKLTSSDGSVTITETNDGGVEVINLTSSGASPLTTKGDLYTYSTTDERLGVGTDGQALIADSAEATGLKWGTVSADNMATADLTLTGDRTHDLNGYTWALGTRLSLSSQGDFNWSSQASGNNFVLNTSSVKVLRVTGGHPSAFLELYSTTAGTSTAQFYSMTFLGNKGVKTNLKLNEQGHTFVYNNLSVGIGGGGTARAQVRGSGTTNATTTLLVENSSSTEAFKILDNSAIIMANLPTSSAGLATGQLWNNSGVLNIV